MLYQKTDRCKSGTDRLTEFTLGENYPRAECNTCHMFRVIRSNVEVALKFGTEIDHSTVAYRVRGHGHTVT